MIKKIKSNVSITKYSIEVSSSPELEKRRKEFELRLQSTRLGSEIVKEFPWSKVSEDANIEIYENDLMVTNYKDWMKFKSDVFHKLFETMGQYRAYEEFRHQIVNLFNELEGRPYEPPKPLYDDRVTSRI